MSSNKVIVGVVVAILVIFSIPLLWLIGLWGSPLVEEGVKENSNRENCYYQTKYYDRQKTIINYHFIVEAGEYAYKTFIVESEWENPRLEITIRVYEGKDVKIILLKDGKVYWESGKVGPYYHDVISLPGTGAYEIRIDNSYSIITDKNVEAEIILHYREVQLVEVCD